MIMVDVFSPEKRSWIMGRVKNRDTTPELIVRSMIHRMGFRFRLHDKSLPGSPDIVLKRHRKVVFVNGCFWHGHNGCSKSARPTSNAEFWDRKLSANIERDRRNRRRLKKLGIRTLVVWECETRKLGKLKTKLERFLES